ncbi:MAG: hypothetical protein OEU54_15720 [Gemmatimonadota bacterium]|nr:hypothetical protein [Gemmatimonadota bacterium]
MSVRVAYSDPEDRAGNAWKIAGAALIGAAVAIGVGVFLARDQMQRHRRDLFSPHPLRRLAALGYLKSNPAVDDVPLLRDYLAWEERPLLRKRATAILTGLEDVLALEGEDREDAEGA